MQQYRFKDILSKIRIQFFDTSYKEQTGRGRGEVPPLQFASRLTVIWVRGPSNSLKSITLLLLIRNVKSFLCTDEIYFRVRRGYVGCGVAM